MFLLTITKVHVLNSQTFSWSGWLVMNKRFNIILVASGSLDEIYCELEVL